MNADGRKYEKDRRPRKVCGRMRPPAGNKKEGSALIIVLAVAVVLTLLIGDFASDLNSELKAAGGNYDEAVNFQLARSALALARLELGNTGAQLYANGHGDAFLVSGTEDYETAIEELQVYRSGYALGRGKLSYRLVHMPGALDPNDLGQNDWHRLLEVACDMDEGEERSALVDCIIDWIDTDAIARAAGMEEADYQRLDVPRHVKNGPLDFPEELLLVNGMTPELLFGYGLPARIEDGMLRGGGLLRYLVGDNSPQGRAAAQYVLSGQLPSGDEPDEEDELEYKQVDTLPEQLYLIAQGFAPEPVEDEGKMLGEATQEPGILSRHIILIRLKLGDGQNATYAIDDMLENASAEAVGRVLAYGIPN